MRLKRHLLLLRHNTLMSCHVITQIDLVSFFVFGLRCSLRSRPGCSVKPNSLQYIRGEAEGFNLAKWREARGSSDGVHQKRK